MLGEIETYHPPEWAASLAYVPRKRVRLAMDHTPVHPWKVPGAPADFSVSIKRDDLTGCALSGNKIRKLEFLMAEAIEQGCRHVITCGSLQSNHCRSVALSARQLGLTPHFILLTDVTSRKEAGCEANMLMMRLCDARMYLAPFVSYHDLGLKTERLAQYIQSSSGESAYQFPLGGSNKTGIFGYINAFEELRQQGVLEQFDDLVFTCGGGDTGASLSIANYLTGGHLRLHGFAMIFDAAHYYQHVAKCLQELGLGHLQAKDLLRILDGYKGSGFELSTEEELKFIHGVVTQTSILLDPTYTAKAALGMVAEMRNNPSGFKGRRVLFIHTGGTLSMFDGRMTPMLVEKEERQPLISMWPDVDDPPF